ncbi:hypothetical protein KGZ78_08185 [Pseudomonas aeruginosa]|nr:hypothetical protein KGZ78_08185 [Pseudomonas aeruginosa]
MPFRLRLPAFLALLQERHQRCLGGVADDPLEAPGALRQGAMQVGVRASMVRDISRWSARRSSGSSE